MTLCNFQFKINQCIPAIMLVGKNLYNNIKALPVHVKMVHVAKLENYKHFLSFYQTVSQFTGNIFIIETGSYKRSST